MRRDVKPESAAPPADRAEAPALVRVVTGLFVLALFARLLAAALPGSRTGIETWIRRADSASGLLAQLAVLLGSSLLVLLVVSLLTNREVGALYRLLTLPAAAAVLMLVMLSSSMGLEPLGSLALGASCLVLAGSSATAAVRAPETRAAGLVVLAVTLAAACRLVARIFAMSLIARNTTHGSTLAFLFPLASLLDMIAVSLAAARLVGEHRRRAPVMLGAVLFFSTILAWGAMRGSLDRASLWQVLTSRAVSELSSASFPAGGVRSTIDVVAVLVALGIVAWPGTISAGATAAALALLARFGVDVPASALVLALAALVAQIVPAIRRETLV